MTESFSDSPLSDFYFKRGTPPYPNKSPDTSAGSGGDDAGISGVDVSPDSGFIYPIQNICEDSSPSLPSALSNHQYTTLICQHCGKQISVPVYCGNRLCTICGRIRNLRVRDRLNWLTQKVTLGEDEAFRHVTLSTKNCHDLAEGVNHLIASFKRLRSSKFWKRRVSGGAWIIEVTKGVDGWHPHIHCLTSSIFLPWIALRNKWKKISGGSGCYLTLLRREKAVGYLTKYLTKSLTDDEEMAIAGKALSHYRLFNVFGTWHKLNSGYKAPKHPCKECGQAVWIPLEIWQAISNSPNYDYHPPPVPSHDNTPDVPCVRTAALELHA